MAHFSIRTAAEETTSIATKDKLNDDNVSGILFSWRFLVLSTVAAVASLAPAPGNERSN